MKKIKSFLNKKKIKIIATLVTSGYIATNSIMVVNADSGIGGNLSNASGGVQSEVLSWANGLGVLLLIACGILAAANKRQLAISLLVGGGIGYLIVKQAPAVWGWLMSIFG